MVMLREGVEAALVVAIILAYINRLGRRRQAVWVWSGTAAAVLISLVAGFVIWTTVGGLEGRAEELVEGIIALAAAGLLTWMIFWMGRQARGLRHHLQTEVDTALADGGGSALAAIAFVAVLREGLESALFMISTTVGSAASGGQLLGGVLGVVAATGVGYLVYKGSHRIDLRRFFRITGVLIVLFAAGLVAKGIHEFQEVGVLPVFIEHLWTIPFLNPDTSLAAKFLASLFGWDPDPSLLQVLGYWGYLLPIGAAFWRMTAKPPTPVTAANPPPQTTARQ